MRTFFYLVSLILLFFADEIKVGKYENRDSTETKGDRIDKVKRAAVTALSAAAVKAKLLADQEENQIRQLTASLIEKQVVLVAKPMRSPFSIFPTGSKI